MRPRRWLTTLATVTVSVLTLTACGGGGGGDDGGAAPELGSIAVNQVPRAQVPEGGTFRWPLSEFPPNFNYHEFNGTLGDNEDVIDAVMPQVFLANPDGTVRVDTDYMTSAELTSTNPQVVTYTINPEATWSNGRPITWEDFRAQWQALNESNPAFSISSSTGYVDIASVERGADDKQAVVTFDPAFADWQSLFNPLYPLETNANPEVFNTGWINAIPTTAGPFRLETADPTAQRIIVTRDENWWGPAPKLERIIYLVVDQEAQPNSYANNEIDFFEVSSIVSKFQRAQQIPNTDIRRAVAPDFRHMTFNGAEGSILADRELRIAIQKGINRQAIADALLGRILPQPQPLGNHIFNSTAQRGYQDNDQVVAYDPAAAERMLDELGWTPQGDGIRTRNGQPLVIRNVIPTGTENSAQESRIAREQLRQIGVDMQIQTVPVADFFENHILVGDFDVTHFAFLGTTFPISSTRSIYALDDAAQQNFGRIGNETINQLYAEANSTLDQQRRLELANQIDTEIWRAGHSLLLYARPDVQAVRSNIANFGAFGLADEIYTDIGFMQQ